MNIFLCGHRELALGLALWLPLALGCGDGRPQRVPIAGKVLIDGKPLECGFIQVLPKANRAAAATIASDGRFTLTTFDKNDGCVLGTHGVAVLPQKVINSTTTKWFAPKRYADPLTSELLLEVTGPRDDVTIQLTWRGSGHDRPFVEKVQWGAEEKSE
jgi:hypothetical protein